MRKWIQICLAVFSFAVVFLVDGTREPLQLITDPAGAGVWGDGYYLGRTPFTVGQDLAQRQLEIRKDGYLNLIVETSALPAHGEITVRLFPDGEALVSQSPYRLLTNHWISGDWRWLSSPEWGWGVSVVNSFTSEEIILRTQAEPLVEESGKYEVPYGAVVSPDGFHVAYLEALSPAVHCYFAPERLWLTDLIEPTRRIDVFDGKPRDVPACSLGVPGYDFSPSGDWLWAKVAHTGGDESFSTYKQLLVFNVDEPLGSGNYMGEIADSSPVAWNSAETRLAFHDRDKELFVYERERDEWTFLQPQWRAVPLGWAMSEDQLWVITADFETAQLILLDVDTNEAKAQIDLGIHYYSSPHFWFSSVEDQFIVQFWGYRDGVVLDRSGRPSYFDRIWFTVFVDLRGQTPQYLLVDNNPFIIDWIKDVGLLVVESPTDQGAIELRPYPELNCAPLFYVVGNQAVNCSESHTITNP